jgi:hypothetical protein
MSTYKYGYVHTLGMHGHTTRNLCLSMTTIFMTLLFTQTVIGTSRHVVGQDMLSSITRAGQSHQYVPRNIALAQNITGQQQDLSTCISKSMDKMLNGYLNFSNADPVSHCFDQFKNNINNGNGTNNNGGGNNNNLNNNPSFSYV